jgi:predicted transcriptional regulator|tara:strand:- start:373 stop:621 length:249 start_codon:yes stop_codon:yes gene_type:complete
MQISKIKYYDIIDNPKRGQAVIFNNWAKEKIESKRLSLLMSHNQFADYLGISRRSFQRTIYNKSVGFEIAKLIINKLLSKGG